MSQHFLRFRRTTILTGGLLASLAGLGFARTGQLITRQTIIASCLLCLITLWRLKYTAVIGAIVCGFVLGWWRGQGYLQQLQPLIALDGQHIVATVQADNDAVYDDHKALNFERLQPLQAKLGIILVQLPPSMKFDLSRLEHLAQATAESAAALQLPLPLALEFRNKSWFVPEVYELLNHLGIANVTNDSPNRWPASKVATGDTIYIRLHGNKQLYRSSYTDTELQEWARFITEDQAGKRRAFVYFDNDYSAVAVSNARTLIKLLSPDG